MKPSPRYFGDGETALSNIMRRRATILHAGVPLHAKLSRNGSSRKDLRADWPSTTHEDDLHDAIWAKQSRKIANVVRESSPMRIRKNL